MAAQEPLLLAVLGPTASGKTDLAEALALEFDAQLINADTFQAYIGMDIGTAKPDNRGAYRLLDLYHPNEQAGTGDWVRRARNELDLLWEERRSAVIVGGSGMNVRALFEEFSELALPPDPDLRAELNLQLSQKGLASLVERLLKLNPAAGETVDLKNPVRVTRAIERALQPTPEPAPPLPPFKRIKLGIERKPQELEGRILARIEEMVHNGWVREVRDLFEKGYGANDPGFKAHGYRAMLAHILGELTLEEAMEIAYRDTRAYTKRQGTWNRKEPHLQMLVQRNADQLKEEAIKIVRSTQGMG